MSLAALGEARLDLDRDAAMEMAGFDDLTRNLVDTMPPPLLHVTRRQASRRSHRSVKEKSAVHIFKQR